MLERIKQSGIELFTDQGLDHTTIEQICERADVARRTFYKHFPSKQHLAHALSQSWLWEESSRLMVAAREHCPDTIGRLRYYIDGCARNFRDYAELERVLLMIAMQDIQFDNDQTLYRWTHLSDLLTAVIEEGQQRGDVTRAFDARFLGTLVAGAINTVSVSWVYERDFPVALHLAELTDFLANALRPDIKR
jgi:AcrR family transcriptional regulator